MGKRFRWTCGVDGHPGILAPSRLRKDDVRRFCWPCSEKRGRLVERTVPALDRRRAAKKVSAAERRKAKAERERLKHLAQVSWEGVNLEKELERLWMLPVIQAVVPGRRYWTPPELHVRHCTSAPRSREGSAWYHRHKIQICVWPGARLTRVLGVLAHEVAHLLDHGRTGWQTQNGRCVHHGDSFFSAMAEVLQDGYGDQPQQHSGRACIGEVDEAAVAIAREKSGVDMSALPMMPSRQPPKPRGVGTLRVGGTLAVEIDHQLSVLDELSREEGYEDRAKIVATCRAAIRHHKHGADLSFDPDNAHALIYVVTRVSELASTDALERSCQRVLEALGR